MNRIVICHSTLDIPVTLRSIVVTPSAMRSKQPSNNHSFPPLLRSLPIWNLG